ncbi:MAG: TonB-dependent receptor [Myxococcales bacterium]|nr:TonB-dependent receptor [Myxococcales bacterium]
MRLTLALWALLATPAFAAPGAVRVYVFDAEAGAPVVDAVVTLGAADGRTNADGRLVLRAEAGDQPVSVRVADGSERSLGPVQVVAGGVGELIVTLRGEAAPRVRFEPGAPGVSDLDALADGADEGASATLAGRVVDEDGAPIARAEVFVRGRAEAARTDADGRFALTLPAGARVDLSVVHPKYRAGKVAEVPVTGPAVTVRLVAKGLSLDDFVVTAPFVEGGIAGLTAERRASGDVVDVVGAEQMSRAGDRDAASALKRVTGLTIVGGRYIYVRGMGERYASTLLNGAALPSPEPERRVVPLDLFPTGVLGAVVVQKTWSPDLPAEFGGGAVLLRTRRVPEAAFFEASVSTGFRPGTTFTDGLTYPGGDLDWLGVDDGTRALPGDVEAASKAGGIFPQSRFDTTKGLSPAELERLGEQMPNVWAARRRTVPPPLGLSVAAGDRWRMGGGATLGVLGSLAYDQDWDRTEVERTAFVVGARGLEPRNSGVAEDLTRSVAGSGMLEVALDVGDRHRIASTTLLLRSTEDATTVYAGRAVTDAVDVEITRLRWVERQLIDQQLRGEHALPLADLQLRWHYAFARADRDEPDRRTHRFDVLDDGTRRLSQKPEGNRRFFSDLDDTTHDVAASLRLPLFEGDTQRGPLDVPDTFVEVGARATLRERRVETYRFRFLQVGMPDRGLPIEQAFSPAHIGPDYQFVDNTQPSDNYSADQQVLAGYALSRWALPLDLRLMAGARVERAAQSVLTFSPFDPNAEVKAELEDTDVLPAGGLTWQATESMLVRAGYGRSVSRPEFRELSPARFDDVTGGASVVGNPDLERAIIDHYDLRWEWYRGPRESVSVAAFYKRFDRPIETRIVPGPDRLISFGNADGGHNMGLEVEARQGFGFVADALTDVYLAGNVALVRSRVELDPDDDSVATSDTRALEGQSPYALNVQLGWEDLDAGHHATLLYNVAGPRIVEVGVAGAPDVFEAPRHQLDLVGQIGLGHGLALKLKAKNLLDLEIERTQGDAVTQRYRAGRSFSVGLSWKL